jgi:hypothetical protein
MPDASKPAARTTAAAQKTAAAAKDTEAAVASMEHEGGPDPEVAKLKKELRDLRAATDERVKRAVDSATAGMERRPESPNPRSADYTAAAELRELWPEAALGDDEDA